MANWEFFLYRIKRNKKARVHIYRCTCIFHETKICLILFTEKEAGILNPNQQKDLRPFENCLFYSPHLHKSVKRSRGGFNPLLNPFFGFSSLVGNKLSLEKCIFKKRKRKKNTQVITFFVCGNCRDSGRKGEASWHHTEKDKNVHLITCHHGTKKLWKLDTIFSVKSIFVPLGNERKEARRRILSFQNYSFNSFVVVDVSRSKNNFFFLMVDTWLQRDMILLF